MEKGHASLSKEQGHGLAQDDPALPPSSRGDEVAIDESPAKDVFVTIRMTHSRFDGHAAESGQRLSHEEPLPTP